MPVQKVTARFVVSLEPSFTFPCHAYTLYIYYTPLSSWQAVKRNRIAMSSSIPIFLTHTYRFLTHSHGARHAARARPSHAMS